MSNLGKVGVKLGAVVVAAMFLTLPAKSAPAAAKAPAKPAVEKPLLVATYGDWGVYTSTAGKGKICYALAQPKTRDPAETKRDAAYAFISSRPSEGVKNEPSFIMGYDLYAADPKKPASGNKAATAQIGDKNFELFPKGADLWVKNPAQEPSLIDEMRKGAKLVIKGASKKGDVTTDTYMLTGFTQAVDKVQKDCAGG